MAYTITPPLVTRASKGSPLVTADMDGNLSRIQQFCNTIGALFNTDGSIDPHLLQTTIIQYLAGAFVQSTFSFLFPVGAAINTFVPMDPTLLAPSNGPQWLLCDGSWKNQTDFPKLFSVLGPSMNALTTGPGGDPTTQFRLPPNGKFFINSDGGATVAAGTIGGEKAHVLTVGELAAHTHFEVAHDPGGSAVPLSPTNQLDEVTADAPSPVQLTGTGIAATVGLSSSTGGGLAHNTMPPYVAGYSYILAGYKVNGLWV